MLNCKFCSGLMKPFGDISQVLICEGCGYFEVERGPWTSLYLRPILGPELTYPIRKEHDRAFRI